MINCIVYKDGAEVFRGTQNQTRIFVHTALPRLLDVIDTGKELYGYTIESDDVWEKKRKRYKRTVETLEKYGNTIVCRDHEYIIHKLKREGWNIRTKRYEDDDGVHYVVEGRKE